MRVALGTQTGPFERLVASVGSVQALDTAIQWIVGHVESEKDNQSLKFEYMRNFKTNMKWAFKILNENTSIKLFARKITRKD